MDMKGIVAESCECYYRIVKDKKEGFHVQWRFKGMAFIFGWQTSPVRHESYESAEKSIQSQCENDFNENISKQKLEVIIK